MRLFGIYKGESLKAIFHLYKYSRLGKTFLINAPLASNCGFTIRISNEKPYNRQSELKRIFRSMAAYLRKEYPNALFDFSLPYTYVDAQPFLQQGFNAGLKYTYRLSLTDSEAEMLSNMSPERRKNVRQAIDAGYQVDWNSNPKAAAKVIAETLSDARVHVSQKLVDRLLEKNNSFCSWVTVQLDGQIRAAAVSGKDNYAAYYLAGGHAKASGDALAGTLALWSIILKARETGAQYFDFHGSSVPSIEQYFRGFGGELTPYLRISDEAQWVVQLKKIKKQLGI